MCSNRYTILKTIFKFEQNPTNDSENLKFTNFWGGNLGEHFSIDAKKYETKLCSSLNMVNFEDLNQLVDAFILLHRPF